MNKKNKTVFNAKWLEEEDFKSWLTSCQSEEKGRYRICNIYIYIELSNMDRQALTSHCNGKKDKENVKIKSFFWPVNKRSVNPVKASEKETGSVGVLEQLTSSKTQATLELVVTNLKKTGAEILWVLNSLLSGYSNNSCSNNSKPFQSMFFDTKNSISDIDPNKIFQVGMDDLNVNLKFLQLVQQDKDENQQHEHGIMQPSYHT